MYCPNSAVASQIQGLWQSQWGGTMTFLGLLEEGIHLFFLLKKKKKAEGGGSEDGCATNVLTWRIHSDPSEKGKRIIAKYGTVPHLALCMRYSSTWDLKVGETEIKGLSPLSGKFKANQGYMKPRFDPFSPQKSWWLIRSLNSQLQPCPGALGLE